MSPETGEPGIAIEGLEARYPGRRALADVSLRIAPGEVCALVGENGSGKTTLLRVLAGLMPAARGAARVAGAAPESRAARRRVGFASDAAPVYERLRVAEDLDHFARAHGLPDRRRRVEAALERVWLAARAKERCGALSRGLRQRLLLARTLLPEPAVLLLDEPVTGLDPHGRVVLRGLLRERARAGAAVLVSSHALAELESICDTAAVLENGRLARHEAIAGPEDAGETAMLLRLREPCAAVAEMLSADARVTRLEADDDGTGYAFVFTGASEALDELLAAVLERGGRVAEWGPRTRGLEALVLDGKGAGQA